MLHSLRMTLLAIDGLPAARTSKACVDAVASTWFSALPMSLARWSAAGAGALELDRLLPTPAAAQLPALAPGRSAARASASAAASAAASGLASPAHSARAPSAALSPSCASCAAESTSPPTAQLARPSPSADEAGRGGDRSDACAAPALPSSAGARTAPSTADEASAACPLRGSGERGAPACAAKTVPASRSRRRTGRRPCAASLGGGGVGQYLGWSSTLPRCTSRCRTRK